MDYKKALYKQLSLDFGVSPEDIASGENLFVPSAALPGRRLYKSDGCILRILGIGGKTVMSCADAVLLDRLKNEFSDIDGAWIGEVENLMKIDALLRPMGHAIADAHHFYIPSKFDPMLKAPADILWLERFELERFRGDERFTEALCFSDDRPDMLAVAAVGGNEILGMAGASADSPDAWQIGIDVLPQASGKGIGTYLTRLLKNEVISRGYLPFYGTVESHITSSRVALAAGFVPAWWELYTARLP